MHMRVTAADIVCEGREMPARCFRRARRDDAAAVLATALFGGALFIRILHLDVSTTSNHDRASSVRALHTAIRTCA